MRASSASSTEPAAPGIAGFHVERELRRAGGLAVYEAIQVELERRVLLTVLAAGDPRAQRFRADAWPEHPHVVRLYAAGMSEQRLFIATRIVPGATTLAQRIAAGDDARGWLADVRAALAAMGAVHGALGDEHALVVDRDDHVLVSGFGLGPAGATADDDERALALLERAAAALPGRRAPARLQRRRRAPAIAAGVAAVAAVAAAMLVVASTTRDDTAQPARAPTVGPGLTALGSKLEPGRVATADCEGTPPSGRSLGCTAIQTALAGRTLVAPRDGVVRAWHVLGARGEVALRVIRRRKARFVMVGGSGYEHVDAGPRSFRAEVPIRRGDLVGLELSPGSGGGFRRGVRAATTARFVAALRYGAPRRPNPTPTAGRDEELLLRVDYAPGGGAGPARLTGSAAQRAPGGRRVDEREIDVRGRATVTVAAVALEDVVVLDVLQGGRRRARIELPGAEPAGRPVLFTPVGEPDLTLAWRNPGGGVIEARYSVTATSITPLD